MKFQINFTGSAKVHKGWWVTDPQTETPVFAYMEAEKGMLSPKRKAKQP